MCCSELYLMLKKEITHIQRDLGEIMHPWVIVLGIQFSFIAEVIPMMQLNNADALIIFS